MFVEASAHGAHAHRYNTMYQYKINILVHRTCAHGHNLQRLLSIHESSGEQQFLGLQQA